LIFSACALALPAGSTVRELPPPLEQLAGSYVGATAGSTLQRLVLLPNGSGYFTDVWFDSNEKHALTYSFHVKTYRDWKIQIVMEPIGGGAPIRAEGKANYFQLQLRLGATARYRQRDLVLAREQTFQSLLDYAHQVSPGEHNQPAAAPE
jgi:hypothetical protein